MTRKRRVGLLAALVGILLFGLVVPAAVAAQDEQAGFFGVVGVDATGTDVAVSLLGDDYSVTPSQVSIIEDGAPIDAIHVTTASELNRAVEIMYVLDVDNRSMVGSSLLGLASSAADATDALNERVRVGVVTAGSNAEIQSRLSIDRARTRTELETAAVEEGAALLDGIRLAAESFSDASNVSRSVVVISTGPDTASQQSLLGAEAAMVQAGAQLVWVGLGEPVAGLPRIVERTAGRSFVAPDSDAAAASIRDAVASAADRLVVSYPGTSAQGERGAVELSIGEQTFAFSYPAGMTTSNPLQLAAIEMPEVVEPGIFGQRAAMYVSVGMAFLAILLAVSVLGSIFLGGETRLDSLLARYSNRDETLEEDEVQDLLVQTALVRRAVDLTESLAARRGFLVRVEEMLERANLPIGAGEGMFFLACISVVILGVVTIATGSVFVGLVAALIASIGGYSAVLLIAKRRLSQFEAQLPDALQLLAGTMRAGYSLTQGLDAVSVEIADPMGQELRRAITETQLGRELEEALGGIAERLSSPDFAWAVMAIGIQREVGGNLSEVLMTVAETMIQRDRLSREVNALTAEGRVSAGILSMMPPGLGLVMWIMNPDYISVLFSRTIGLVLIGLAVFSGLTGLLWMKKVITIDV